MFLDLISQFYLWIDLYHTGLVEMAGFYDDVKFR